MDSEGVGNPGKFRPDVRGDSYVARSVLPEDLEDEYRETKIVRDGMDDVISILQENGAEVMDRP
jgi:hypothetical protein